MHSYEDISAIVDRWTAGETTREQMEATVQRLADEDTRECLLRIGIGDVDGVPWHEAPLPKRWHRCRVQSGSVEVQRCACGGLRRTGSRWWIERNSRRKKP